MCSIYSLLLLSSDTYHLGHLDRSFYLFIYDGLLTSGISVQAFVVAKYQSVQHHESNDSIVTSRNHRSEGSLPLRPASYVGPIADTICELSKKMPDVELVMRVMHSPARAGNNRNA